MDSDTVNKKNKTLLKLNELFYRRLEEPQAEEMERFASLFFTYAPEDEMALRSMEALYGASLSTWAFLQSFDGQGSKI